MLSLFSFEIFLKGEEHQAVLPLSFCFLANFSEMVDISGLKHVFVNEICNKKGGNLSRELTKVLDFDRDFLNRWIMYSFL